MSLAPPGANRQRAAFTLLELLSVLAIIALLAGLVTAGGRHALESARVSRARAELAALSAALESYSRAYGDYPRTADAAQLLQSLLGRRSPTGAIITGRACIDTGMFTFVGAADPSVDATAQLADPWGRPYAYRYRTPAAGWENPSHVLYSLGPDGRDSGVLPAGGYADTAAPEAADNLYANRPY